MKAEKDKKGHTLAGAMVCLFFMATAAMLGASHLATALIGVGSASTAGLLKEGLDWYANYEARKAGEPDPHTVDPLDWAWTVIGGVAAGWSVVLIVTLVTAVRSAM